VTSQGETLIVLDKNGRPLRKAIVWLDNRAKEEAETLKNKFGQEAVYHISGQQDIVPGWPAAKILWLRKHEPTVFKSAAKFLMLEDYLIYRLTGKFATDHAMNPSTLYYDMIHGRWWPEMLDFLGISTEQLPMLLNSGEVVGKITADVAAMVHPSATINP
jgi:xylulokinase